MYKWRIGAPVIAFNNLGIIDLFSYKVYEGPHKDIRLSTGLLIVITGAHLLSTCAQTGHFLCY